MTTILDLPIGRLNWVPTEGIARTPITRKETDDFFAQESIRDSALAKFFLGFQGFGDACREYGSNVKTGLIKDVIGRVGAIQNAEQHAQSPAADAHVFEEFHDLMEKEKPEVIVQIIMTMFDSKGFFEFADPTIIENLVVGGHDAELAAMLTSFVDDILARDDARESFLNTFSQRAGFSVTAEEIREPAIVAFKKLVHTSVSVVVKKSVPKTPVVAAEAPAPKKSRRKSSL